MPWFNGTINFNSDELEKDFPVYITNNLRTNSDESKIAIINDFPEGSELYEISDPLQECDVSNSHVFYHTFLGEDASKAREFIYRFIANGHGKREYEVNLYRVEEGNVFLYSYGELHTQMSLPIEKINNLKDLLGIEYFILPLKVFRFRCPVCGEKVLKYRAYFYICKFCGWEDDGTIGKSNAPGLANGDYTVRTYRKEYKRQLRMVYDIPYKKLTKQQRILPCWMWNVDNCEN